MKHTVRYLNIFRSDMKLLVLSSMYLLSILIHMMNNLLRMNMRCNVQGI